MTYFVVSDVHSYYDELIKALEEKDFDINNPEHILISCGDLCDRGNFPIKCINFVMDLYNKDRAILIRGNHEDLMEEAICRTYFRGHDIHNCTTETAEYLTEMTLESCSDYNILNAMKTNELWNSYINATVNYYELDNYIFVHGWIPTRLEIIEEEQFKDLPDIYKPTQPAYNPDWKKFSWGVEWEEARWMNGMKAWNMGIKEPGKTIVCGHYHTSWGHAYLHNDGVEFLERYETYYIDPDTGKQEPHVNNGIFYDDGIIAIDACTAISHKVNVLKLEIDK